jgi:hypothetical protein
MRCVARLQVLQVCELYVLYDPLKSLLLSSTEYSTLVSYIQYVVSSGSGGSGSRLHPKFLSYSRFF